MWTVSSGKTMLSYWKIFLWESKIILKRLIANDVSTQVVLFIFVTYHTWAPSASMSSTVNIDSVYVSKYSHNYFSKMRIRSSRSQMFFKIGVLKNFTNFTLKHLCWILFWIKLPAIRPATLLKRLQHRCFPVKFAKILRIPF